MADHPLLAPLLAGDRRALARAITLVESRRAADRAEAAELLAAIGPRGGRALRVGISGPPGAGKSTFIEALGLAAIADGRRVAVLAVDPSSSISGGAILGDKTRMERLGAEDSAFIRPSPSGRSAGGVAQGTEQAMQLCEAAGYDLLLVETVGVGQSEAAVAHITDLLVLLQLPNTGDDLQAIKRGVLELADAVVVNKADLDAQAARRAALQLGAGLAGRDSVWVVSALSGEGIAEVWSALRALGEERHGTDRDPDASADGVRAGGHRPFRVLGLQQVAIGGEDKQRLRHLWVDLLGVEPVGQFTSERENVDEDICALGDGAHRIEIDLMQPLDVARKPAVHVPPLNHIGLWVDDLPRAVEWLSGQGMRFAPGGIRKGAAGHDVCFIHPRASDEAPLGGEGVLIELVQAPSDVIAALAPRRHGRFT